MYPETKFPAFHNALAVVKSANTSIEAILGTALAQYNYSAPMGSAAWARRPIFLQSFDLKSLKALSRLSCAPSVLLLEGPSLSLAGAPSGRPLPTDTPKPTLLLNFTPYNDSSNSNKGIALEPSRSPAVGPTAAGSTNSSTEALLVRGQGRQLQDASAAGTVDGSQGIAHRSAHAAAGLHVADWLKQHLQQELGLHRLFLHGSSSSSTRTSNSSSGGSSSTGSSTGTAKHSATKDSSALDTALIALLQRLVHYGIAALGPSKQMLVQWQASNQSTSTQSPAASSSIHSLDGAKSRYVSTGITEHAHAAGMLVHAYTARPEARFVLPHLDGNVSKEYDLLLGGGMPHVVQIDGLFTDHVPSLRAWMEARGHQLQPTSLRAGIMSVYDRTQPQGVAGGRSKESMPGMLVTGQTVTLHEHHVHGHADAVNAWRRHACAASQWP